MGDARTLHILFKRELKGYTFNPHRPQGLEFLAPEGNLGLQIRCEGKPGDFGYGSRNLVIEARTSATIEDNLADFVDALTENRYLYAAGSIKSLPYTENSEVLIEANGTIKKGYTPTWDMLPQKLQEHGMAAYQYLLNSANRFIGLLRWQLDAVGEVTAIEVGIEPFIYWRTKQETYHLAPFPNQGIMTLKTAGGISWDTREQTDFLQVWSSEGLAEPLGHELLREARQVATSNERAALLIAYTSLEVGVKQHISKLAPVASWLTINSPSPPVNKLLRNYIPILHSGNPKIEKWDDLKRVWKLTSDLLEDRNKLAHQGKAARNSIEAYLQLVSDLLYSLDYLEGQEWARALISTDYQAILGWKGLGRPGVSGYVRIGPVR